MLLAELIDKNLINHCTEASDKSLGANCSVLKTT